MPAAGSQPLSETKCLSLQSYRPAGATPALKLGPHPADKEDGAAEDRLRAACQSFEGLLVGEMMKAMRQTSPAGEGVLAVGRGESIFAAQQCEALGSVLAERQPLGIAGMLWRALGRGPEQLGRRTP
jgi:Rod binding domain-containing protein